MNMDQMPIPYLYHVNKMLNLKGAKTVQGQSSTSDTKHVALTVTVTASGKLLAPFLIFKGQQNGRIVKCKLQVSMSANPKHG